MASLENELENAFAEYNVSPENQKSIKSFLELLQKKDESTYEHSIRVGVLGARIARHMHLDPKALLFSGLLHDTGKLLVPPETLKKTEGFNEKDRAIMNDHPGHSYELLRGIHEFSAEIALRHHRFQENGYPKKLPKPGLRFSPNTCLMIDFFARILSLADFYDAVTTRVNDKFGEKKRMSPDEAKAILLMKNPDQKHLIQDLYTNGIFGEEEQKRAEPYYLRDIIWQGWTGTRNPRETRRYVILASALEPLSEKIGCTTRETNAKPHQKLEYYVAGAINIGDAFEDLCARVEQQSKQPGLIYDLALRAQSDCKKNRAGGRVNQGIIELLTPIVAAQMLFDKDYTRSVQEILEKAKEVLKNTSSQDIDELMKMKRLAYDLSGYTDREVPKYDATNVYDYYTKDLQNSQKTTSIKHNEEFVLGFPTVKKMHDIIMNSSKRDFNKKVEEAYAEIKKTDHKDVSPGLTADCTAAGIYLVFSHHPKDDVIR